MNTTKAGELWRREGDRILLDDSELFMEDLRAMVLELEMWLKYGEDTDDANVVDQRTTQP